MDVTVVNLKEANRHNELGKGTLYISLCKKFNEGVLTQYHRWIFENHRWESVETLKEFVLQEAEFQTVALETIRGVTSSNRNVQPDSRRDRSEKAFFGNAQESEIHKCRPCKVCKGHHGVWRCDKFKDLPVQERWNTAKRLKLCFRCLGGDHRVLLPGKDDEPALPNNYEMALRRLLNTEKRLLKNPEIGEAYTNNINQYLEKGYIRRLDPTEKSPLKKWYLRHFPVVRPDRTTTKTRIVFDASAKFEGVSLNDAIYQGPKLQRELTDVLLRFPKKTLGTNV